MTPKPQANKTIDEIREALRHKTESQKREAVLALITEARATERQAMLDALPEKKEAYDNITTLNGEDYIVESESYNQAILQMEAAIKLMGGE